MALGSSELVLALGSVEAPEGSQEVKSINDAASSLNGSQYDKVQIYVNSEELSTLYQPMELSQLAKNWKPDAEISVYVVPSASGGEAASLQPIHTSFLLAGLGKTSERKENGVRILSATRHSASTTVSIDLIDENALLDDTVLAPPPNTNAAASKTDDCGGRKPCDDCTCGRKEELEGKPVQKAPKSSACGKCGMGDAFRCASCPYLGKPAFKAGEEHLVLDLQDDL